MHTHILPACETLVNGKPVVSTAMFRKASGFARTLPKNTSSKSHNNPTRLSEVKVLVHYT